VIVETIVTTLDAGGAVNIAPMGVEWADEVIVLKPFLETATYRNVAATRAAVVNLTDDVRIFARAATSNPAHPTVPAVAVRGVVLADCCTWREVEVRSIDSAPPRSRIETSVVHRGARREFVEGELTRLQTIVDKTAGPRELEAMAILADYIRSAPREPARP